MDDFFGFESASFQEALVEESFVAGVQHEISRLMKSKGINRAELARRLNVSAPAVTQMLGDEEANLTLRTVAKIFSALEEKAKIVPISALGESMVAVPSAKPRMPIGWGCLVSNDRWALEADDKKDGSDDAGGVSDWASVIQSAA